MIENEAVLEKGGIVEKLADIILRPFNILGFQIGKRIVSHRLWHRILIDLDDLVGEAIRYEFLFMLPGIGIHPHRQIIAAEQQHDRCNDR